MTIRVILGYRVRKTYSELMADARLDEPRYNPKPIIMSHKGVEYRSSPSGFRTAICKSPDGLEAIVVDRRRGRLAGPFPMSLRPLLKFDEVNNLWLHVDGSSQICLLGDTEPS